MCVYRVRALIYRLAYDSLPFVLLLRCERHRFGSDIACERTDGHRRESLRRFIFKMSDALK